MEKEGLNQKDFSSQTGISQATLSSIFNGRTSPTLNHAQLLHKRFPDIRIEWLLYGEGDMRELSASSAAQEPKSRIIEADGDEISFVSGAEKEATMDPSYSGATTHVKSYVAPDGGQSIIRETIKYIDKPQRRITEIRIFFDDGTYEVYPGLRMP